MHFSDTVVSGKINKGQYLKFLEDLKVYKVLPHASYRHFIHIVSQGLQGRRREKFMTA